MTTERQKSLQNQCFRRFLLARFYSGHFHDPKSVLRCSLCPGATSLEWGDHIIRINFRTFPEIPSFRNVALGPLWEGGAHHDIIIMLPTWVISAPFDHGEASAVRVFFACCHGFLSRVVPAAGDDTATAQGVIVLHKVSERVRGAHVA